MAFFLTTRRRRVATAGLLLATAAAIGAVAVIRASRAASLPSEIWAVELPADAHSQTLTSTLREAGVNALVRTANARSLVLTLGGSRRGVPLGASARAGAGHALVAVRGSGPDAVAAVAAAERRGHVLVVVRGSSFDGASWTRAARLAHLSPSVDLAVVPSDAAALRSFLRLLAGVRSARASAPGAPRRPALVRASQTSLLVSWRHAPGGAAAAYRVDRDGVPAATVVGASGLVRGLDCGSSYTIHVSALDSAGDASPPATLHAATTLCPLRVAANGSDANACTPAAPCLGFDRAYHVARPGQLVEVDAGTYGDQDVRYDRTKTSRNHVVFRPVRGAAVTIGDLTLGPDIATRGASHVTFRDMTLKGDIAVIGCGAPSGSQCLPDATAGGNDATFQHLTVQGPYGFFCASCSNIRILGGTIGPPSYGHPCNGSNHPEVQNAYDAQVPGQRKLKRSHGIVIDGTIWQNFSSCVGYKDHTECLQVEPADDVVIRNSIFRRCDTITVNFANDLAGDSKSRAGYAAPDRVLIENNFFDAAQSLPHARTYFALNIRECTNCTIRYNSWLQAPRLPNGEIARNVEFVGNVGRFDRQQCDVSGVTFSHNVWVGARCARTDKDVSNPGFVDPAAVDLHLTAASPAIRAGVTADHPARDIDGQPRPRRSPPDAGADQRNG
jgi:hypothetical protein